jgi:hypothetical protein
MPTVRRLVPRAVFFVAAVPAVVRAAWRARRLARSSDLRQLPGRLRCVPPFAVRALARPAWLDGAAARLLPWLPPYGYGPCLKRSLVLLDLWSRCGLEPRFHLGVRRPGEDPLEGHAWVTVGDPALDRRTGPQGWDEMWSG